MKKSFLVFFFLLVGTMLQYSFKERVAMTSLPNITLEDINGQKVNVSELGNSGRVTVINFWATWCTPCKKELTNMIDMAADWKEKNIADVIAISIDDSRQKAKIKTYVEIVNDPYLKDDIMESFSITERDYYEILAKFNQQNRQAAYLTDPVAIKKLLFSFFNRNRP